MPSPTQHANSPPTTVRSTFDVTGTSFTPTTPAHTNSSLTGRHHYAVSAHTDEHYKCTADQDQVEHPYFEHVSIAEQLQQVGGSAIQRNVDGEDPALISRENQFHGQVEDSPV